MAPISSRSSASSPLFSPSSSHSTDDRRDSSNITVSNVRDSLRGATQLDQVKQHGASIERLFGEVAAAETDGQVPIEKRRGELRHQIVLVEDLLDDLAALLPGGESSDTVQEWRFKVEHFWNQYQEITPRRRRGEHSGAGGGGERRNDSTRIRPVVVFHNRSIGKHRRSDWWTQFHLAAVQGGDDGQRPFDRTKSNYIGKLTRAIKEAFDAVPPLATFDDIAAAKQLLNLVVKCVILHSQIVKPNGAGVAASSRLEQDIQTLAFGKLPTDKQQQYRKVVDEGKRQWRPIDLRKYLQDEIISQSRVLNQNMSPGLSDSSSERRRNNSNDSSTVSSSLWQPACSQQQQKQC